VAAATVQARLLGSFELTVDGWRVERAAFERPSGLRLLKLLLATPGHRVRREAAAELLWPEADPDRSGANLRKAIHFARRAVAESTHGQGGSDLPSGEGDWLSLGPGQLEIDADRLGDALGRIEGAESKPREADRGLREALEILALLGGQDLLPEDPYEEWLVPLRERLRQRSLTGLVAGAVIARVVGQPAAAFALVDRALALEPADEGAHRVAIELHLDAGHVHAARRQLQACVRAVAEAYGVEPAADLAGLIDAVATRRVAAPADRVEAPIVGRRQELDTAEAELDRVAAGRTGVVLLRGPAGIGKSRVLRELLDSTRASRWRIVAARGLESAPEAPFAALGRGLVGTLGVEGCQALPEPGRSALKSVAPWDAEPPEIAFGADEALSTGLVGVLDRLAAAGPTVIAVDDVQWLDPASVALLERALGGIADRPLLVALTHRDDRSTETEAVGRLFDAIRRLDGREIVLKPLGPREIRVVVEREVAPDRVDDQLAVAIERLAGGSPLFALELLRGARETGAIELRDGRWRLRPDGGGIGVPRSVVRIVEARVGRLPDAVSAVLATAAELDDDVAFEELVAASEADPGLVLEALDAAIEAGLIDESPAGYRFGHPLFRAALRKEVPGRRRGEIHARVARALARSIDPADHLAIDAGLAAGLRATAVADHAARAAELGRPDAIELAVGFGLAAGVRQARLFDDAGAVAMLERVLALWHRLPEASRGAYRASWAEIELSHALKRLGREADAASALARAVPLARNDVELAEAFSAAAWLPYDHGRFERSDEILADGLSRVSDPGAIAVLQSARGWILIRRDMVAEAYPMLVQAVAVLERSGPSAVLMRTLDRLAVAVGTVQGPAASIPVFERALGVAVEIGETGEIAALAIHLAGSLRELGRLDEAMRELDRARAVCIRSGERYVESVTEWVTAEVDEDAGRHGDAIRRRRRELELLAAIGGNPRNEAMAHAHIASLAHRLDDDRTARIEAESARAIARHAGLDGLVADVDRTLGTESWAVGGPA